MFKEYYEKLLKQLSLEFNCTPSDFHANENIITKPVLNEGRRNYGPDIFLQMATCGVNTVIMADERLHEFLREWIKDKDAPHWQQIGIDVLPPYRCSECVFPEYCLVNAIQAMGAAKPALFILQAVCFKLTIRK